MRRLVLGDIHGRYEYLVDVFRKANVDFENDLLIQIGDIVDRGPDPFTCIDLLMKFKNRVFIVGNHDQAFIQLVAEGRNILGPGNGVEVTVRAWNLLDKEEQFNYLNTFFREQKAYHITGDNICFVHGGFDNMEHIENQSLISLCWDRELVNQAMRCKENQRVSTVDCFKEIFIGHTPTIYWDKTTPIFSGGVINVDTGSGKGGPLTIMDIDTKEYWQSDLNEEDKLKLQAYGIIKKIESPTPTSEKEDGGESQEKG
jgi:serine/threonine protein phosphatase 1